MWGKDLHGGGAVWREARAGATVRLPGWEEEEDGGRMRTIPRERGEGKEKGWYGGSEGRSEGRSEERMG
eukprot:761704-Hanusia_phi.AAC.1